MSTAFPSPILIRCQQERHLRAGLARKGAFVLHSLSPAERKPAVLAASSRHVMLKEIRLGY